MPEQPLSYLSVLTCMLALPQYLFGHSGQRIENKEVMSQSKLNEIYSKVYLGNI